MQSSDPLLDRAGVACRLLQQDAACFEWHRYRTVGPAIRVADRAGSKSAATGPAIQVQESIPVNPDGRLRPEADYWLKHSTYVSVFQLTQCPDYVFLRVNGN